MRGLGHFKNVYRWRRQAGSMFGYFSSDYQSWLPPAAIAFGTTALLLTPVYFHYKAFVGIEQAVTNSIKKSADGFLKNTNGYEFTTLLTKNPRIAARMLAKDPELAREVIISLVDLPKEPGMSPLELLAKNGAANIIAKVIADGLIEGNKELWEQIGKSVNALKACYNNGAATDKLYTVLTANNQRLLKNSAAYVLIQHLKDGAAKTGIITSIIREAFLYHPGMGNDSLHDTTSALVDNFSCLEKALEQDSGLKKVFLERLSAYLVNGNYLMLKLGFKFFDDAKLRSYDPHKRSQQNYREAIKTAIKHGDYAFAVDMILLLSPLEKSIWPVQDLYEAIFKDTIPYEALLLMCCFGDLDREVLADLCEFSTRTHNACFNEKCKKVFGNQDEFLNDIEQTRKTVFGMAERGYSSLWIANELQITHNRCWRNVILDAYGSNMGQIGV